MPNEFDPSAPVPNEPRDDFNIIIPETNKTVSYLHKNLREVVSIHEQNFEQLLYRPEEIPLELGELFEQVGNRYLDFSAEISAIYVTNQSRLNKARKPIE